MEYFQLDLTNGSFAMATWQSIKTYQFYPKIACISKEPVSQFKCKTNILTRKIIKPKYFTSYSFLSKYFMVFVSY